MEDGDSVDSSVIGAWVDVVDGGTGVLVATAEAVADAVEGGVGGWVGSSGGDDAGFG